MTATDAAATIDVRLVPPYERHRQIFDIYDNLAVGEAMHLINDHDPRPLYNQMQMLKGGGFNWNYLQSGPEVWQVSIRKVANDPQRASSGGCCSGGNCGG